MTYLKKVIGIDLHVHGIDDPDFKDELASKTERRIPYYDERDQISLNDPEFKEMMMKIGEGSYYSLMLEVALMQHVEGNGKNLRQMYADDRGIFKGLQKGPDVPLFRMINLSDEQIETLNAGSSIKSAKSPFASWSMSLKSVQNFMEDQRKKGATQVIFKKNVAKEDRLVCVPCSHLNILEEHEKEEEIICKNIDVSKSDIVEMYRDGKRIDNQNKAA